MSSAGLNIYVYTVASRRKGTQSPNVSFSLPGSQSRAGKREEFAAAITERLPRAFDFIILTVPLGFCISRFSQATVLCKQRY